MIIEPTEIRLSKRKLVPMLCFLLLVLAAISYIIYFLDWFTKYQWVKTGALFFVAFWVYAIYLPAGKVFKNEPILIVSKEGITINEAIKPISLPWYEIQNWQIKYRSTTYYLFIYTEDTIKEVNISWLEMVPLQLEQVLKYYEPKSEI